MRIDAVAAAEIVLKTMRQTIEMRNGSDNTDVVATDHCFTDCIAEGIYFVGAKLTRVTFTRCDMYWALFIQAELTEVIFDQCDLRGSNFTEATLSNCRFVECEVGTDNVGGQTIFDEVDLSSVRFESCRGR